MSITGLIVWITATPQCRVSVPLLAFTIWSRTGSRLWKSMAGHSLPIPWHTLVYQGNLKNSQVMDQWTEEEVDKHVEIWHLNFFGRGAWEDGIF